MFRAYISYVLTVNFQFQQEGTCFSESYLGPTMKPKGTLRQRLLLGCRQWVPHYRENLQREFITIVCIILYIFIVHSSTVNGHPKYFKHFQSSINSQSIQQCFSLSTTFSTNSENGSQRRSKCREVDPVLQTTRREIQGRIHSNRRNSGEIFQLLKFTIQGSEHIAAKYAYFTKVTQCFCVRPKSFYI